GDDRRITITADQLKGDTEGSVSAASQERSHWTGVYKAWERGSEPGHEKDLRPEPELITWLVSGEETLLKSVDSAKSSTATSTEEKIVKLVGAGTLGTEAEGHVEVPLISLNPNKNQASGNLAWWIGDQGVKAMVTLPEP